MVERDATLTTFYEEWQRYHDHLTAVIAPLSAEQLGLRAAPGLRSIGELVAHVIEGRVGWFAGFMGVAGEDADALTRFVEGEGPYTDAGELVRHLEMSRRLVGDALGGWSAEEMRQTFGHDWRGDHYELSRGWVAWHVLEHDLHHGGEISLMLGMHGLQAPDV